MFQYLSPKKIRCASIVFISLIFTSFHTYVQQQEKFQFSLSNKQKRGEFIKKTKNNRKIKNILEDFMQTTIK